MEVKIRSNYIVYIALFAAIAFGITVFFAFNSGVQEAEAHNWLGCGGSYSYYCACSGRNLVCTQTGTDCVTTGGIGDHTHLNHALCSPGSITVRKTVAGGSTQSFPFSTSQINHPTTSQSYSFSLTSGGSRSINNVIAGTYTVSELEPSGWNVSNISCTSDIDTSLITTNVSAASFTVNLRRLEDISCTFTNVGCTLNVSQQCSDGNLYNYDSCGNRGSIAEFCDGNGCSGGSCNLPPPPPNAPTVNISVSPSIIDEGQSSTISWTSTNAASCQWASGFSGSAALSGSKVATPTSTTTYTISCSNSGGSDSASAVVTVSAPACTENDHKECVGDVSYWYDSCGNRGALANGCRFGCENGECLPEPPPYPDPVYTIPCAFNSGCELLEIWTGICRRLLLFATPIFIIMILIAAYDFLIGGAQAHRINRAKKTIQYGAIGYIILLLSCFLPQIIASIL